MALELGDISATRGWAEEALAISRGLDDSWLTALSTLMLAQVLREEHDFKRAHELYAEAEREFVRLGDEHPALIAAFNFAWMTEELGDKEGALRLHDENLRRACAVSNPRMESVTLYNIARFARDEGRFRDAMEMTDEAYRIVRDLAKTRSPTASVGSRRSSRAQATPSLRSVSLPPRKPCARSSALGAPGCSSETKTRSRACVPSSTKRRSRRRGSRADG